MSMKPITTNMLFFGDNLEFLSNHDYFPNECVDLVYLDPPFNSNRTYNVLFKDETGREVEAQAEAFKDTWHWMEARAMYDILREQAPIEVGKVIESLYTLIGGNQMMAYLVMMTPRLVELHRLLRSSGVMYLHCDPTAGHYLKVVLDAIFGTKNFVNEIVWERFNFHADAQRWGRLHDIILFYAKDATEIEFHTQRRDYDPDYIESHFKLDAQGRLFRFDNMVAQGQGDPRVFFGKKLEPPLGTHWRYSQENIDKLIAEGRIVLTSKGTPTVKRFLDEMPGHAIGDVWTDIPEINSQAAERLGYPTQKPLALLKRIISASSNPNDVVLDPFGGCGTTIVAAQELGRKWIGIDITYAAIHVLKNRLDKLFPDIAYQEIGSPRDVHDAREMAERRPNGRYDFQWWVLTKIGASPRTSGRKKGADRGIDGWITFKDYGTDESKRILVQVKSGHVERKHIAELSGDMQREEAVMGVIVTLEPPSSKMEIEAGDAGYYKSSYDGKHYPKIQILTVEDMLRGVGVKMPPSQVAVYKQAERAKSTPEHKPELPILKEMPRKPRSRK